MSARSRAIAQVLAALTDGRHVELIGAEHSGRTVFLRELQAALHEQRWVSFWVGGAAAIRAVPFGALAVSGFSPDAPAHTFSAQLAGHVQQLAQRISGQHAALLIDNVDELDDASWGAVVAYTAQHPETRVVTTGHGLVGSDRAVRRLRALTVQLPPLTYRELRDSVEAQLGAPLDDVTLGQIFARSGASAGLAQDLVDAAVLNGGLRREENVWVAQSGLWSPELGGAMQELVAGLSPELLDALELLAIAGVSDLDAVREVLDCAAIEALEAAGLVRVHPVRGQLRIAVHPPLLEDYFRHRPLLARRTRLTGLVAERLDSADLRSALGPSESASTPENAVIARMFHEQAQTRVRLARAAWASNPSAATAVSAVKALVAGEAPDAEIEAVLDAPLPQDRESVAATHLLLLRAEWRAFAQRDLDGALDMLAAAGPSGSVTARITDTTAVSLEHYLRQVPRDFAERLEVSDDLPPEDQVRGLRALTIAQTTSGDFEAASHTLAEAEHTTRALEDFAIDSLRGVVQLGLGEMHEATAWARRGYAQALAILDVDSLRSHGAVLVYALEAQGRYAEAEDVLATLVPLSPAARTVAAAASSLAIQGCAALIAARRGRREQAQRHLDTLRGLSGEGLPPLHQSPAEAEAQLLVLLGQRDAAADLLRDRGADLIARGYHFAGVLLRLASLEVRQDPELLAVVAAEAEQMGGAFVLAYLRAVRWLHRPTGDDPVAVAEELLGAGRTGLAIAILDHAVSEAKADAAPALRSARERLRAELPDVEFETRRFEPDRSRLTERELEVARLVTDGLSNAQIATELVVSVRTVESHIHRLIRKLGVTNRHDVKASLLG